MSIKDQILKALLGGPMLVAEIVEVVPELTRKQVSDNLVFCQKEGLVEKKVDDDGLIYSLTDKGKGRAGQESSGGGAPAASDPEASAKRGRPKKSMASPPKTASKKKAPKKEEAMRKATTPVARDGGVFAAALTPDRELVIIRANAMHGYTAEETAEIARALAA